MNNSELQKIKQRYNIVGNCDGLDHALDVALQVAPTDRYRRKRCGKRNHTEGDSRRFTSSA